MYPWLPPSRWRAATIAGFDGILLTGDHSNVVIFICIYRDSPDIAGLSKGRPDMLPDLGKCALMALLTVALPMAAAAQDNGLVLYGAGSLREAMTEMAALFSRDHGIAVRTEFAPSAPIPQRLQPAPQLQSFPS